MNERDRNEHGIAPRTLFWWNTGYLLLFIGLTLVYVLRGGSWIPDPRGIVRIAAFGSLGGIVASFDGILRHLHKWQPQWSLWYAVRPLISAAFGVIGYLAYVSIIQASVSLGDTNAVGKPTYVGLIIAFVLGYKEETFRDLMKRVIELLATAGGGDVEPPSAPPDFDGAWKRGGVTLTWGHSTDNVKVIGYNIYRDQWFLTAVRHHHSLGTSEGAVRATEPATAARTAKTGRAGEAVGTAETARTAEITPPVSLVKEAAETDQHERLTFIDTTAGPGTHRYSITAFDNARNESDVAGPVTVTVTVPPSETDTDPSARSGRSS